MVWLGLGLGIINISRGDKFFFHFFEIFFERAGGLICLCLVRFFLFVSRLGPFFCAKESIGAPD